ncbi:hypothetical protein CONLIGDRAFT_183607 [Coniochaeta ligniaria NRRL 30616]|uniref:Uncharacterized protein n=1 Tax=Coniochaeta ligniaria NRRL 30616 TaxID=1408157 RepID=A0A1J7JU60_9PEZI|nr:hypothetical protein CONLIGDRAFT_183607 [Coniochaeta ligniaria NRRL 30616]
MRGISDPMYCTEAISEVPHSNCNHCNPSGQLTVEPLSARPKSKSTEQTGAQAQRQRRGLNPAVTLQRRFRASLQHNLVVDMVLVLRPSRHRRVS